MQELANIKTVRAVMERHGLSPAKGLGQNFIIDPSVCPRMAELSGAAGAGVIEIGPGLGVLTGELAAVAERVVAVELDAGLAKILPDTLHDFDNIVVLNYDIMKTDVKKLIEAYLPYERIVVCANLPYYITSPVIMKLLEDRLPIDSITVMVQKEAAARLCAEPGSRECGAVTVSAAYFAESKKLFGVPAGCFYPVPRVDSAVIRLDVRKTPAVTVRDEKLFFRVIKGAFAQRRKTVQNSLSASLGLPKGQVADALASVNIPPAQRAEKLTLADFAALSDALAPQAAEGE